MMLPLPSMFAITPDEDFLFLGSRNDSLVIAKIDVLSGDIFKSLKLDAYQGSQTSQIVASPTSREIYFNIFHKDDTYGRIWRWHYQDGSSTIDCRVVEGIDTARAIAAISSSRVYSVTTFGKPSTFGDERILLITTDFGLLQDYWSKEISWGRIQWSLGNSAVLFHQDTSTLFNLVTSGNRLLFFQLDADDGETLYQFISKEDKSWREVFKIENRENLLYLVFGCGEKTEISVFNIPKNEISVSYKGSLRSDIVTFTQNLAFIASNQEFTQTIVNFDRAHADSLNCNEDFRISSHPIMKISGGDYYTIEEGDLHEYSDVEDSIESTEHEINENTETKDGPPSTSVGDIEYFLAPADLGDVINSHFHRRTLELTRVHRGDTVVKYSLQGLEEEVEEVPPWVGISQNMSLTIEAPYVPENKDISFYVNSVVVEDDFESRGFSKLVSVRVKKWQVGQWLLWNLDQQGRDIGTCAVCIGKTLAKYV